MKTTPKKTDEIFRNIILNNLNGSFKIKENNYIFLFLTFYLLKGMWYLRKVASSCEQLGPVSTCSCPKYIKFCFQNLVNGRENKNGPR